MTMTSDGAISRPTIAAIWAAASSTAQGMSVLPPSSVQASPTMRSIIGPGARTGHIAWRGFTFTSKQAPAKMLSPKSHRVTSPL